MEEARALDKLESKSGRSSIDTNDPMYGNGKDMEFEINASTDGDSTTDAPVDEPVAHIPSRGRLARHDFHSGNGPHGSRSRNRNNANAKIHANNQFDNMQTDANTSQKKPKPKAGYTCKVCGKPGGEPDSHWFQLCPQRQGELPPGWNGNSAAPSAKNTNFNGGHGFQYPDQMGMANGMGNHRHHQHHPSHMNNLHGGFAHQHHLHPFMSDASKGRSGKKSFQPPKVGYVCKICGKEGGGPDSHWFQQCPLSLLEENNIGGANFPIPPNFPPDLMANMQMLSLSQPVNGEYAGSPQMMFQPSQLYYMTQQSLSNMMATGSPTVIPGSPSAATGFSYGSAPHFMYPAGGLMMPQIPGSPMGASPIVGAFGFPEPTVMLEAPPMPTSSAATPPPSNATTESK